MKNREEAMEKVVSKTRDYMEDVFGSIRVEYLCSASLPISGQEAQADILEARLGGLRIGLVLIPGMPARKATPAELRQIVGSAGRETGLPAAVVLPSLAPYKRNRLVNMGVSFIVPGEQMFLLPLGIDFRDYLSPSSGSDGSTFSVAAQLIVMHHLLVNPLEGVSMSRTARSIAYSVPTVSDAVNELQDFRICETRTQGRSIMFEFAAQGRKLWELCLPHMRSPVNSEKMVCESEFHRVRIDALAGIGALAHYGLDVPDSTPAFASHRGRGVRSSFPQAMLDAQHIECGQALVQRWVYCPRLLLDDPLQKGLPHVDPLSLYLSLRDAEHEGIADKLDQLIDNVEWRRDMQ